MAIKAVITRYKNGKDYGWNALNPVFADDEVKKLEAQGFTTKVELLEMGDDELPEDDEE